MAFLCENFRSPLPPPLFFCIYNIIRFEIQYLIYTYTNTIRFEIQFYDLFSTHIQYSSKFIICLVHEVQFFHLFFVYCQIQTMVHSFNVTIDLTLQEAFFLKKKLRNKLNRQIVSVANSDNKFYTQHNCSCFAFNSAPFYQFPTRW